MMFARSLLSCCENGDLEEVATWLESDESSLIDKDQHGNTALHVASEHGRPEIVQLLIYSGACVDTQTYFGDTSLHLACTSVHVDVVQLLVQAGASVDEPNNQGKTALHIASRVGNESIVDILIRAGACIDRQDKNLTSALHEACSKGNQSVVQLLLLAGADLNIQAKNGWTPLHFVCLKGHFGIAQLLVCAGAAIDIQDKWDMDTPLHRATKEGHLETAQLLIQVGAHPTIWNMSEKGGLEVPPWSGRADIRPVLTSFIETTWHATPLHRACYEGDIEGLNKLLKGDPEEKIESLLCSISDRDQYGWTALHVAVFMNCIEATELLISKGADVFAVTGTCRYSVLHLACTRGYTEIFRIIISSFGYSKIRSQSVTDALKWTADLFSVNNK